MISHKVPENHQNMKFNLSVKLLAAWAVCWTGWPSYIRIVFGRQRVRGLRCLLLLLRASSDHQADPQLLLLGWSPARQSVSDILPVREEHNTTLQLR